MSLFRRRGTEIQRVYRTQPRSLTFLSRLSFHSQSKTISRLNAFPPRKRKTPGLFGKDGGDGRAETASSTAQPQG